MVLNFTLIFYVDDIIVTGNDPVEISQLKLRLACEFEIKDLGQLRYFLGIKVARSMKGICVSQQKYALDLLTETDITVCKPIATSNDANHCFTADVGDRLIDASKYQRLVDPLYLTITRLDIAYAVNIVNQFMHALTTMHLDDVYRILHYLKRTILVLVCCTLDDLIYLLRVILMRIGLVLSLIVAQPLATALLLVVISLLGEARNNLLLPILVLKLSSIR